MKTSIIIIGFLFLLKIVSAQDNSSKTNFENKLSWEQIRLKAAEANKFIFLDFQTSWCAPCKRMESEIFVQDSVASALNKNFIAARYQCDTTQNDSQETKSRYPEALKLEKELGVEGYPSFIILSANGEIVHRIVGYRNATDFISELEMALHPETQYTGLTTQYNNGKRDADFLLKLINTATRVNDYVKLNTYINSYLKTQKNLLTKKNIEFIVMATKKSTDIGFNLLSRYPQRINAVVGKGKAEDIVSEIVFNEVAISHIRVRGKAEFKPEAMMTIYSGEIKRSVNWSELKKIMDRRYPKFSSSIINYTKLNYYSWNKEWENLIKVITSQLRQNILTNKTFERAAQDILFGCDDQKLIMNVLNWYDVKSLPVSKYSFWTKSDLLFKIGKTKEAVFELEAHKSEADSYQNKSIENAIKKMQMGKSRWDD
ncbi:thioredoxin family protein [Pedobacter yonginense]|nr:thioredoxin family protein [Pedobacter yonginense]